MTTLPQNTMAPGGSSPMIPPGGLRIRPGKVWYLLAALLLLIGYGALAGGVGHLVSSIAKSVAGAGRVVVPGSGTVTLDEPGEYTVHYEYRSVVAGKVYRSPEAAPALECRLVFTDDGTEVPLRPASMSHTYEYGSRAGESILGFHADRAGVYELSAEYPEGEEGPNEIVLAVGGAFPVGSIFGLFAGIGVLMLCGIAALVIFLVTLLRRASCKQRLREELLRNPPVRA